MLRNASQLLELGVGALNRDMGISGVKSFQFADAAVVLIDSMTAARKTTRDALYDFGFRDFDLQDGAAAARKRMRLFHPTS